MSFATAAQGDTAPHQCHSSAPTAQRHSQSAPSRPPAQLQLHEETLFPKYRGAPLQRLLEACDACSGPGTVKDHYAPRSSACYVCASNRKVGVAAESGCGCRNSRTL